MTRRHSGIHVPPECREMIRAGALVAISTSGGKDSQAMTILLSRIVPRDQLVAVHAPLEDVEWPGTLEHIEATLPDGVPLILARVTSGKTLLDSIEERGPVSFSKGARVHEFDETWTNRARTPPPSQGASPLRRPHRQRHGHAGRGKPRPGAENALEAQRAQLPRGADMVRLAADSRPHRRTGLRRHPRRGTGAASGLRHGHVPAVLRLLHHGLARGPSHRRPAPAAALRPLLRPRTPHRPHAVAVPRPAARPDRSPRPTMFQCRSPGLPPLRGEKLGRASANHLQNLIRHLQDSSDFAAREMRIPNADTHNFLPRARVSFPPAPQEHGRAPMST